MMGIHIQKFNQRIQNLNQSGSRELNLGAKEARDLHSEIFGLLAQIADLERRILSNAPDTAQIAMDGGNFSR